MSQAVFDRFRLDGRIALVTGASSGLGTHFAMLLASAVLAGIELMHMIRKSQLSAEKGKERSLTKLLYALVAA